VTTVTPLRENPERTERERQPPQNIEAEQALLGVVLCDNSTYHCAADIVDEADFANALHGRIWSAIGKVICEGKQADPVLLKDLFEQDETYRAAGGGEYLTLLVKSVVTTHNVPDYARHLRDLKLRREAIAETQTFIDDLYRVALDRPAGRILAEHAARVAEQTHKTGSARLGINPRTLAGLPVPPRRFIVSPWIPMRRVTGLYGVGGIGKTTLMQMLCTSTALDRAKFPEANWLGLPVPHYRSVLLFCEDDLDEMHARQEEINRVYGCTMDDLGDMLWLPRLGEDNTVIAVEHGKARRTPFFYELLGLIKNHGAQLVVWDTLTDVFSGSELDRGQARRFVQEGPGYIAREIDGSVICCAHPSLTGIKTGSGSSGSTGWDAGFRSRLYLHSPKEEEGEIADAKGTDERLLDLLKANWAPSGKSIPMRWRDGVLIADRVAGGIIGSIERHTAERVFLDLLAKLTGQGRYVSHHPRTGNYAPKILATQPDSERFGKPDFERAMQRLFDQKKIKVGKYTGPSRHKHECILTADPA
jgi:RecA-family ATPase